MDLFDSIDAETTQPDAGEAKPSATQPLADRMRPRTFEEWVGQEEVAGPDSPLRRQLSQDSIPSMILWGPPGCGKTTLARLVARETGLVFHPMSAVTSGVRDVKEVIEQARRRLSGGGRSTLLFIDEIHRFNKAQQDAFLPHIENGTIVLIGATTENPSFSVIAPLLSRCRALTLGALMPDAIQVLLRRALEDTDRGLGEGKWKADDDLIERIAQIADGDARRALNTLEQCTAMARGMEQTKGKRSCKRPRLTLETLAGVVQRDRLFYDRGGEEHFNLISAFHKSMRASDPQGALYWLFRMLAAGEDPLWVARRIVACASEDIGMADPQALVVAVAALHSFQSLGLPEGELPLAQATIYNATAPKSNSVKVALDMAKKMVKERGSLPVPLHLRNAPTGLMKDLGYGREYQYDHDSPEHFSGQPCLPEEIEGTVFYEPGAFGFEKEIAKRIEWWNKRRDERGEEK